ncbi:hypothetical protein [Streptomyces noursei]
MFLIRFPDDFHPESWGWEEVIEPAPPERAVLDDQLKHRFPAAANSAFPERRWLRWQIPYRFPAVLCQFLKDEATSAIGGWYGPVDQDHERQATVTELWDEIRTPPWAPRP